MGRERTTSTDGTAERIAEATLESWETVAEAAARQQEHTARFALRWTDESIEMLRTYVEANLRLAETLMEQSGRQAGALRGLTRASAEVWVDLLFTPVLGLGKSPRTSEGFARRAARDDGRRLPIEDYDRLSIEEISRRLEEMSVGEIMELRAYEQRHKNRVSLLERFDRVLV